MKTIVGRNDVVPGCGPRTSAEEALEVTEARMAFNRSVGQRPMGAQRTSSRLA